MNDHTDIPEIYTEMTPTSWFYQGVLCQLKWKLLKSQNASINNNNNNNNNNNVRFL